MTEYVTLSILWIIWCFLHSLLIAEPVTRYLQGRMKTTFRYFRLLYNMFSIVSFLLIYFYGLSIPDEILFSWTTKTALIPIILTSLGLYLMYRGAKSYNMNTFLGITQLNEIDNNISFNIEGILKYSRHPWYLGGYLLLWSAFVHLTIERLIINIIFTLYLYVGTVLEERKLVNQFGDVYRKYQKKVPMYIPYGIFKR
ncbi:MAG: DUF1295 domain-containing protein [Calditrichaeota bacterium]|nr:MAG: DUF1295 domain-containing protein [Calditrichota bacterium]